LVETVVGLSKSLNLAPLTSLASLHLGCIKLLPQPVDADPISRTVQDIFWTFVSSLSHTSPSEIFISFSVDGETAEEREISVKQFEWVSLVERLQHIFSGLKQVVLRLGYRGSWYGSGLQNDLDVLAERMQDFWSRKWEPGKSRVLVQRITWKEAVER
jgi:hypothetical protein